MWVYDLPRVAPGPSTQCSVVVAKPCITNLVLDRLNHLQFTLAAILCSLLVFATATNVPDELILSIRQPVFGQEFIEVFHWRVNHLFHSQWNLHTHTHVNYHKQIHIGSFLSKDWLFGGYLMVFSAQTGYFMSRLIKLIPRTGGNSVSTDN